ncbi:MAG: hypothetical protein ACOC71_02630 [Hyphomicrobiales bacterium]
MAEDPISPSDAYAASMGRMHGALDRLKSTIDAMLGEGERPSPEAETLGYSPPTVIEIVRQSPQVMDDVAERTIREAERLREAFLR